MAKKLTGIQKKSRLSEEMAAFMHAASASRTDIIKKLWVYIKKNNLQDPDDKKEINLDDTLADLLGPTRTNMFKLSGLITPHLLKEQ